MNMSLTGKSESGNGFENSGWCKNHSWKYFEFRLKGFDYGRSVDVIAVKKKEKVQSGIYFVI